MPEVQFTVVFRSWKSRPRAETKAGRIASWICWWPPPPAKPHIKRTNVLRQHRKAAQGKVAGATDACLSNNELEVLGQERAIVQCLDVTGTTRKSRWGIAIDARAKRSDDDNDNNKKGEERTLLWYDERRRMSTHAVGVKSHKRH